MNKWVFTLFFPMAQYTANVWVVIYTAIHCLSSLIQSSIYIVDSTDICCRQPPKLPNHKAGHTTTALLILINTTKFYDQITIVHDI